MQLSNQNRYDREELREYISQTIVAVILLWTAGFAFEAENKILAATTGFLGLIFAISVIHHYYTLIISIDEIEGFISHLGLLYFMKFGLCFTSGIVFARSQYIECLAGIFIITIFSVMLIYGYRDMLVEIRRSESGENMSAFNDKIE